MNDLSPILVTGAHRSGTTWVGKMLAADSNVGYISEPLNVLHRPGVFRAPVKRWYTYINNLNESEYLPAFHELLNFEYHTLLEIRSIRSSRDFLRMGRDFHTFLVGNMQGKRVLLKDPFAVFSVPWFAQKLNSQVVITVRHPAGFASGLKRLNWSFDFRNLLEQPALMQDHLEADRAEMESVKPDDIIGQSALLWRMIYRFVDSTRSVFPDFKIVRHKDLSLDPVTGYKALYESLGLTFTERVSNLILKASNSENPTELSTKKVHSVKLDSRANVNNWKKHLSVEELTRIRKMTEGVSELFYSDKEWE